MALRSEKTKSWKTKVISLLNFEFFVFSVLQALKEITQILFQICLTSWEKYIEIQSLGS